MGGPDSYECISLHISNRRLQESLKLLHCPSNLLLSVYLCGLFFKSPLAFLLLIMVELRTIHIVVIWNGNLESVFLGSGGAMEGLGEF